MQRTGGSEEGSGKQYSRARDKVGEKEKRVFQGSIGKQYSSHQLGRTVRDICFSSFNQLWISYTSMNFTLSLFQEGTRMIVL